jgi:hypothetical protein
MIDLWETLGRLVYDNGMAASVKAAANTAPTSPTLLLVKRPSIDAIRTFIEAQPWSTHMSTYAAGEICRFVIHSEFDGVRNAVKEIQAGLKAPAPPNPTSGFYQTLGAMIIDPNVGNDISTTGQFPKFAAALPQAEKLHLRELAGTPGFQAQNATFLQLYWDERACLARLHSYQGYVHVGA